MKRQLSTYPLHGLFPLQTSIELIEFPQLMANKIIIDTERCKGCGLCVIVCPKNGIVISEKSNKNGYFPAEPNGNECTGCANCAIICSEAVIEVYRDSDIVAIESQKKLKPSLSKEKS